MIRGAEVIRAARSEEAAALSDLAIRSKAHWSYTPEQLDVFREELRLDPADLRLGFVLERGDALLGFYTLVPRGEDCIELEHLFVAPDHLRAGHGEVLLQHAIETARARRDRTLRVQSDPNAAGFYQQFGFVTQREIPTSIPGRTLPLMERALVPEADRVVIDEPLPDWPERFRAEVERVRSALGDPSIRGFEHFGSTAVPGLAAKPVLDFAILVSPPVQRPAWIAPLEALGYSHWSENPDPERMLFIKGMPPRSARRTHHLHVRAPEDLAAELAFRDALRADRQLAQRYLALKRSLVARVGHDREAYTEGKTEFVRGVLDGSGEPAR